MIIKKVLICFFSSSLGIISAILFLLISSKFPLSRNAQIYKIFGIQKPVIIGFQPYWLLENANKDYDPYITTTSYFGLVLNSNGTIQKLVNEKEEEPGWTTLRLSKFSNKLKGKNSDLSLAIHSSDEDSIAELLTNPKVNAKNLIADITPIMKRYNFTDLNLDIESFKESSASSQKQFTEFVKEIKKEVEKNNLGTLTVEMSPTALVKNFIINGKDIGGIADYVVIMAYDYHYLGSYVSGPVAPLRGAGKTREFDVETGLKEALKVIPAKKIILGIPLYGYQWEALTNKPGSATIPQGGSTASNKRVERLIQECKNCITGIDELSKEPYIIFRDEQGNYYNQIFYSNQESVGQKIDLATKYKIGGIALWALGYDGEKIMTSVKNYKQSFFIE